MSSGDLDFDFSIWDFPEDRIWIRIPDWEMALKIATFVPVILFGLLGNYIIVRLIYVHRSLRTPTNLLISNMAVADFLTLLICPVLFMIKDFYQNYMLGSVGCKLEGYLEAAFLITAVLNLSVVSYDRLTAIVLPMETRLSIRGAKIVITLTWLVGFLIAAPLAIYREYKVRVWKNFTETYCKENPEILPKYWYVLITVIVWLPLGVMLICYTAIFYKLDRYEKRNLSREHPLSVSYKQTVAKTLFIVVIVFVILRVPFTIMIIVRDTVVSTTSDSVSTAFHALWYTSQYLMMLNAAVNPLIYGFKNDNFRRAYAQTPIFYCCRAPKHKRHNSNSDNNNNNSSTQKCWRMCLCCCFASSCAGKQRTCANASAAVANGAGAGCTGSVTCTKTNTHADMPRQKETVAAAAVATDETYANPMPTSEL